ncbi:MAG: TraR/DksA C4-type zinc finger protein [Actinomycetota bacterium]|nr:MAG: DnaK suppressor [Actinomycetota bacterium]MDO8949674.1 TraR/DksA C4-type zinc finger protein [Actinomycetota bacterium]MDP3629899.1 TraR/DksA C4-type zinc finger protein [Actinomycetota bacterium]
MNDEKRDAKLKSALESERAELIIEIEEYEREGQESLSDVSGENNYRDHMADQGSATFARELDMSLEDIARENVVRIDAALGRMASGEYGVCTRCGAPIPAERLEAMPDAELCIECKEWEETR